MSNKISKFARISSRCILGKNNIIGDNVIIHDNVKIGNNNKIYDNTIIYPQTTIGDNNVFLEGNKIGCIPVEANLSNDEIINKFINSNKIISNKLLIIGNNNFFHINNKISIGYYKKTIIGNDNKFLSDIYISHDNIIHNEKKL